MKKGSPITSVLFTVFLFVFSVVNAQQNNGLELVSNSGKSLNIKFDAPSLSFYEVETPNGLMSIPVLENGSPLLEKGAPDLQKFACSYIIPKGESPKVEIINSTYKDYKVEVAPSKGNLFRNVIPSEVAYVFGEEYQQDAFFPATLFETQTPHIVRDFNAQALWIYPMQYNPISKLLRVYSSIELEVSFTSPINFPRAVDSQFDLIYKNLFLNYDLESKSTIDSEDGSMLIISYNEFMDPMQDFMAWKTQKGIVNEIVDVATIGGADEIKAYIQDYYDSHNLTYVLLVGDHQQVPSYQASSGYSDNYYGYLDGDDSYPEVLVGRFSAEDKSQVTTQVNRVLQYEQNPPISDAFAESVVVGSDQGPGDDGEYDYEHLRNIQALHLDYTYTTAYELFDGSQGGADADGNPSASDLHVLLEDDLGIINYTGHGSDISCGSSGYSNTQVNNLTNTEVHPFFWSVACVNGNFTGTTCFAEAWLRATHNGEPTGAIATLMSTINQSWSPPMEGQDHMNFILTEASVNSDSRSFGGISMNGCMQMNDTYGGGGADMTDTWTCFGDPSVIVRTQAPQAMAVSYNPAIPVGSTSLDVSCSTEGALVSLTLDGEIIGTAVVSGGMATVNFDALSSIGDITVTVTAFNTIPEIGATSVVVLDGPWLVVTSYELSGDEDGMFSYGESYDLHFTVENIGTEATSETNIGTIVDGPIVVSTFGDYIPGIAAGESYTYTGIYFPTSVMNSAVDGDEGIVNFSMSSDEGSWASSISIPLHAPVLEVTNVDAQLSFGESTTAYITLTNNGTAHFNGGTATLSVDGTYLSVVDAAITVESLASGESITLAYDVSLDADAPSSTFIDASLVVTEGWFEQSSDFVLETPMCQSSDLNVELTIMTDSWGSETSWNFTNADGVVLASVDAGTYESSSTYTAMVCASEGTMMTFNIQDTYGDGINAPNGYWVTVCGNEVAQGDAFGSGTSHTFEVTCDVYVEIPGCMDVDADNYNSEANIDDASCEYTIDCETANPLQLTLIDSYGDGWNGNYFEIYDSENNQVVSTTLEEGLEALFDFCLNDGCYTIATTNGGSYTYEVSWILTFADDTVATGVSPSTNSLSLNTDCGFVNGCTDQSACNYNENANIENGSCEYAATYYACDGACLSDVDSDGTCDELEVYGCTNVNAPNYNTAATEDDGSCEYVEDCEANFVIVNLSDSYGDGWNGNMLYITNSVADTVATLTIETGSAAQQVLCLENDCYLFTTTDDGGWPYEVSWSIVNENTTELLSGTAPSNLGLSLGTESCDFSGCIDPLAFNYNPNALEDDGSCEYEQTNTPWEVLITGSNHTIAIGGDTPMLIDGNQIAIGDWIGVFYTDDNGDLQCAGYSVYDGETDAIAAQGDDSTTDEIDGFQDGESFVWMIWDASEDVIYNATVTYLASMPSVGEFVVNGISALETLETSPPVTEQLIEISDGWSIFSTYILADNMYMGEIVSDIVGEVVIVKDYTGLAYLPEWDFNGIGDVLIGQGYQIKLNNAASIVVEGTYMLPEENPITLTEGWNILGVMRLENSPVESVFADFVDQVVIVKNSEGMAYLPDWGFSGFESIEPGQGYQVKMLSDQTFNYLSNDTEYRSSEIVVNHNSLRHFAEVIPTGNNMTIVIESAAWDVLPTEGAEIAAFDKVGNLIGSAVYNSPVTVLTVWGDDATTETKDGLALAENVTFKVWSNNSTNTFEVANWLEGSASYQVNAINLASTLITNVLADELATERVLVKVINVLGQEVISNAKSFKGEILFNVYNDGTVEKIVK